MDAMVGSAQSNAVRAYHPVLAILALALGCFGIGTTEFATMSLLPYYSQSLGIDEVAAGHVISAYAVGVVVGAPVLAVAAARVPRRTLLMVLMMVFGIGNGLSALAPSYGWLVASRFIAGLPHGAYIGVAALVAATLVPRERRSQAISYVFAGLTVATMFGVPLANMLGQLVGWRWSFALVAGLAALTMLLLRLFTPHGKVHHEASPLRELGALRRPQVWLTLGIGAIGFGGMFAVYTYLASTILEVTHASPSMIPLALGAFGLGFTVGNLFCGWAAGKAVLRAAGFILVWCIAVMAIYPWATASIWTLIPAVFLIGSSGGMGPVLQTRLMDVARDAQTLAATLNHAAFNTANALGPWLAGMALAAGFGLPSTGWVGVALAFGGLCVWACSVWLQRATDSKAS